MQAPKTQKFRKHIDTHIIELRITHQRNIWCSPMWNRQKISAKTDKRRKLNAERAESIIRTAICHPDFSLQIGGAASKRRAKSGVIPAVWRFRPDWIWYGITCGMLCGHNTGYNTGLHTMICTLHTILYRHSIRYCYLHSPPFLGRSSALQVKLYRRYKKPALKTLYAHRRDILF